MPRKTDIRSLVNAVDRRKHNPSYRFSGGRIFFSPDESNRDDQERLQDNQSVNPDDYGRKQNAQ